MGAGGQCSSSVRRRQVETCCLRLLHEVAAFRPQTHLPPLRPNFTTIHPATCWRLQVFSYRRAGTAMAAAGFHMRTGCTCNPGACYGEGWCGSLPCCGCFPCWPAVARPCVMLQVWVHLSMTAGRANRSLLASTPWGAVHTGCGEGVLTMLQHGSGQQAAQHGSPPAPAQHSTVQCAQRSTAQHSHG